MRLSDLLTETSISVDLKSQAKEDIIRELLELAVTTGNVKDKKATLQDVMKREELMSTGLEKGIAVPHAKSSAISKMTMALGISKEGVDFNSADGKPSHLFFMLLAPEAAAGPNVQALGQIARLTAQTTFCEDLTQASSASDLLDMIKKLEM